MSFTAPPTSPDCIVFANTTHLKNYHTCRRGENHWRSTINSKILVDEFRCAPVFYKGAFYQLDRQGRLVILDTKSKKYCLSVFPKPTRPNILDTYSYYAKYIAECDGEFVVNQRGYPVHVFKLDWSEMEWVALKSLGNRTMFIGETTGCLLVPAANTIYQNKIYFPDFRRNKKRPRPPSSTTEKDTAACVFYSLETRKYHALGCDFSSKDLCGTRSLANSIWIEPNLNMTQDEVEDNWY